MYAWSHLEAFEIQTKLTKLTLGRTHLGMERKDGEGGVRVRVPPTVKHTCTRKSLHVIKKSLHVIRKSLHVIRKSLHVIRKSLHVIRKSLHVIRKSLHVISIDSKDI